MKRFTQKLKEKFLNREKIKNYLGLSRKARYLIIGADNLKNYDKKLYLILKDSSSSKTIEKVSQKFKDVETFEVDNLGNLVSIENCKIVGIKNLGLSEEEAHKIIEKQAMDTRQSKREVAETVLRTYK